jgi:hypothetical protein
MIIRPVFSSWSVKSVHFLPSYRVIGLCVKRSLTLRKGKVHCVLNKNDLTGHTEGQQSLAIKVYRHTFYGSY